MTMSDEDRAWITEQFRSARTENQAWMTGQVRSIELLLEDTKESLEREIREGFGAIKTRFDVQSTRLERHAAMLQTGSRWTNRINQWAEKVDAQMEAQSKDIAELRARLTSLDREQPG